MHVSVVLPVGWLFLLKEQGQVVQEVGLGLQHRLQGFLQCPVILPGARAPLGQDLHDLLVMGWMSLSIHLKHTVCILRKSMVLLQYQKIKRNWKGLFKKNKKKYQHVYCANDSKNAEQNSIQTF